MSPHLRPPSPRTRRTAAQLSPVLGSPGPQAPGALGPCHSGGATADTLAPGLRQLPVRVARRHPGTLAAPAPSTPPAPGTLTGPALRPLLRRAEEGRSARGRPRPRPAAPDPGRPGTEHPALPWHPDRPGAQPSGPWPPPCRSPDPEARAFRAQAPWLPAVPRHRRTGSRRPGRPAPNAPPFRLSVPPGPRPADRPTPRPRSSTFGALAARRSARTVPWSSCVPPDQRPGRPAFRPSATLAPNAGRLTPSPRRSAVRCAGRPVFHPPVPWAPGTPAPAPRPCGGPPLGPRARPPAAPALPPPALPPPGRAAVRPRPPRAPTPMSSRRRPVPTRSAAPPRRPRGIHIPSAPSPPAGTPSMARSHRRRRDETATLVHPSPRRIPSIDPTTPRVDWASSATARENVSRETVRRDAIVNLVL